MSTSSPLLVTLLLVASAFAAIHDFDENKDGYEFIYHDNLNVIIAIHRDKCYFSAVPDNHLEWGLSDSQIPFVGGTAREHTEQYLIKIISDNSNIIHPSSLEAMREKYKDLLADFHCLEKQIFEMVFPQVSGGQQSGGQFGGSGTHHGDSGSSHHAIG